MKMSTAAGRLEVVPAGVLLVTAGTDDDDVSEVSDGLIEQSEVAQL